MTRDELGIVVTGAAFVGVACTPWYGSLTAWRLGLTGLLPVLLVAYAAVRVLWVRARPLKPDVPLSPAAEPFAAAVAGFLVLMYRAVDAPDIAGERTLWLSVALAVSLLQVLCAARNVARTGFRA